MAAKKISVKRYVVKLSGEECAHDARADRAALK